MFEVLFSWVDGCTSGSMDGWMYGWMNGWIDGSLYEWVIGQLNRVMDSYMD